MNESSGSAPASHEALAVVLQVRDGTLQVLLWQRAREPFHGAWALPGGLLGVMKDGWRRWQRRRRPVIRAEESVPVAALAQAEAEDSEARAEAALASLGTVDERSPR